MLRTVTAKHGVYARFAGHFIGNACHHVKRLMHNQQGFAVFALYCINHQNKLISRMNSGSTSDRGIVR